jgi:predicted RNase H-like HicB family nuclease
MPTKAEAIQELEGVFDMIAEEFQENGQPLPMDTTAIVHA